MNDSDLRSQSGFGNEFASEAVPGAAAGAQQPQQAPHGLYAERYPVLHSRPRGQSPQLDVSPAAVGGEQRLCAVCAAVVDQRCSRWNRHAARPLRWARSIPMRRSISSMMAHRGGQRRRAGAIGHGSPDHPANRSMKTGAGQRHGEMLFVPQHGCTSPPNSAACRYAPAKSRSCRGVWRAASAADGPSRGYV